MSESERSETDGMMWYDVGDGDIEYTPYDSTILRKAVLHLFRQTSTQSFSFGGF